MNESILSSYQRAYLRKLAHHLHPLVSVGKAGLNEAICKACSEALEAHELIKVKFQNFQDERQSISEALALDCGAALVSIIGNTAILYKESEKEKDGKIRIPRKKEIGA